MNCTGKRCIMQYDKVDPATCPCVPYCPQATPPKTNADRIRGMSDEELAKWIEKETIFCCDRDRDCRYEPCEPCLLRWLKSKAEVDE